MFFNYFQTHLALLNAVVHKPLLCASLVLVSCLSSCIAHKDLLNVQSSNDKDLTLTIPHEDYLLQPGDLLSIKVASLDPNSIAIFNKSIGQSNMQQNGDASIYLISYVISDSGFVYLPIIGNVAVKGLSLPDAQRLITSKMDLYYKYASVDVKLMSFRVTLLGEVNKQGTFIVYNPNNNILQLIGEAGGITDMGDRKRIRVIRKKENQSTLSYIDLSSDLIMTSNYFYLQPNDIVYVEPLRAKAKRLNLPIVQASISVLTFIIVVLSFSLR